MNATLGKLHNAFIASIYSNLIQKSYNDHLQQQKMGSSLKILDQFDPDEFFLKTADKQNAQLQELLLHLKEHNILEERHFCINSRNEFFPSFATKHISLNYYDRYSIRSNLQLHAKYATNRSLAVNGDLVDLELRRKCEKLENECRVGRCQSEGEISDTVGVAALFFEYAKLAGLHRTELNNEMVDLIYFALENYLKGIVTAGLRLHPSIQSTSKKKRKWPELKQHETAGSNSSTSTSKRYLTGSLLKLSQELHPFVYGEDVLSLDYFNL